MKVRYLLYIFLIIILFLLGPRARDSLSDDPQTLNSISWLQTNKIKVMELPSQYLDLNTRENLWGVSEAKPRNVKELWIVLKSSWAGIPVHMCQKLVDSMQHRCEAVLGSSGYTTKP
uniref:Uncharacterized protein n=1 Tax=Echeneis naucrates TaxID=173247 RepID=A0A665UVG7_ECHNA